MVKKLVSGITAVLLAAMMFTTAVFADDDAVFCFDNDTGLTYWSTEGEEAIKATGFKIAVSNSVAYSGAGSLVITEDMSKEAEKIPCGAYFSSSAVGVPSLAGCTVSVMIYPEAKALDLGASIVMYSDGEVYIPISKNDLKPNTWNEITFKVPDNCNNTKIGFNIPLNRIYNGTVFYLDEIKITQQNGAVVPNIGDFEEAVPEILQSLTPLQRYLMYGALAVIVIGLFIFGITALVKSRKKYR
jgi:hypothetical protein